MKIRRRSIAAAVVLLLGLSACSSGSGSGDSDTLTFQSLAWQPEAVAATKQAVKDWNDENPDKPVEYVQGDWGNVQDSLVTGFEGGKAPDIIHWEGGPLQDFATRGNLLDLDGKLSKDFESDINDAAWSTVQYDGVEGTYGVPYLQETQILVANKKMLADAGIKPATIDDPWTWDEFQKYADQLTKDSNSDGKPEVYGAGMGLDNPTDRLLSLAVGLEGEYFDLSGEDGATAVFDDAEAALPEMLQKMMHEDKTLQPSMRGLSGSDVLPSFFQGKTGMIITPIYTRRSIMEGAENVEGGFDWVAMPAPAGESQDQASAAQAIAVNANTSDEETAVEFTEFLLSPERQVDYALGDWLLPTSKTALKSDELNVRENGWDVTMASANHLAEAPFQRVPGIEEWTSRVATPAFDDYFANKITTEELSKRLVDDGNEVLERYQR